MDGDLKRNMDKSLLLFTKVYVYVTNTKKPWDKLNYKQLNSKKFVWTVTKWFMLSKNPLTKKDVLNHIKTCPELYEPLDNINNKKPKGKKWKNVSVWYHIYEPRPLRGEYDLKLLIETIGLRMLHFVTN